MEKLLMLIAFFVAFLQSMVQAKDFEEESILASFSHFMYWLN